MCGKILITPEEFKTKVSHNINLAEDVELVAGEFIYWILDKLLQTCQDDDYDYWMTSKYIIDTLNNIFRDAEMTRRISKDHKLKSYEIKPIKELLKQYNVKTRIYTSIFNHNVTNVVFILDKSKFKGDKVK